MVPIHTVRTGIALKNEEIPFVRGNWKVYQEGADSSKVGNTDKFRIISGLRYSFLVVDSSRSSYVWLVVPGGAMERKVLLPRKWFAID